MNSKSIIILFILVFQTFNGLANNTVSEADSAYNAGNYTEAIELFSDVISNQGISAALLFNLGNAYYQAGDLGQAMLCYQRAKKLDPSNKQIKANLNFLTEKINDANKAEQRGKRRKVTEDEPNFFQSVHKNITEESSSNTWAGWAAAFFLIFAGAGALYSG